MEIVHCTLTPCAWVFTAETAGAKTWIAKNWGRQLRVSRHEERRVPNIVQGIAREEYALTLDTAAAARLAELKTMKAQT